MRPGPNPSTDCLYVYQATVIDVYDGDTCHLDIDMGLHDHRHEHLRLAHINAPELHQAGGTESRRRFVELLDDGPLTIRTLRDRTEKYGRWLAEIVNNSGINIGDQLVKEGLAVPYEGGRR